MCPPYVWSEAGLGGDVGGGVGGCAAGLVGQQYAGCLGRFFQGLADIRAYIVEARRHGVGNARDDQFSALHGQHAVFVEQHVDARFLEDG